MGLNGFSATERFIRIRVKVERAEKHLRDLENELKTFGNKNFHAVTTDVDTQTGQSIQKLGKHHKRPFEALSIAGDIVHNLRSALDHLANELVWVGSDAEPTRRVEFPIAKDAATYERDKATKVEGMCPKVIKAIDALQPYKGGKGEILWRLHELDNIDKHRTLFAYSQDCMLVADWLLEYSDSPYNLKRRNPEFAGIDALDSEVEQEMELEIDKAILESQIAKSNAMLPSLIQLVDYVKNLILAFTPFLE